MRYFLIFFLLSGVAFAQISAFQGGENLTYSVSFQASGVYSDVAQIDMSVTNSVAQGKKTFRFQAKAQTYSNFDKVFRIRDNFTSVVYQSSLIPILHKRSINEGGYQKEVLYVFDVLKGKAYADVTRKGSVSNPDQKARTSKKSVGINNSVKDILGALYYMRAISFGQLKAGQKVKLDVIFDAKVKTIYMRYAGKKTISTKLGSKICHQFDTSAQGDSNSFSGSIFFTADANKVPVLITANIPVGKAKIEIKSANGLKN